MMKKFAAVWTLICMAAHVGALSLQAQLEWARTPLLSLLLMLAAYPAARELFRDIRDVIAKIYQQHLQQAVAEDEEEES